MEGLAHGAWCAAWVAAAGASIRPATPAQFGTVRLKCSAGWQTERPFPYALDMARKNLDSGSGGELRPTRVPSGDSHTFIVRTMKLDHRYHDEDPVQNADFTVRFPSGLELKGKLDGQGKATLVGVPGSGEVRYGPDQRPFERVNKEPNPDFRGSLSAADFEALRAKYSA